MKLFLRLLQYIKPYSAYLIGALACIIVLAATTAEIVSWYDISFGFSVISQPTADGFSGNGGW